MQYFALLDLSLILMVKPRQYNRLGAPCRGKRWCWGIMLPNHAPLVIAEQFGTLATLYPGWVDLAPSRTPGTDGVTAHALRRHMEANDNFPHEAVELLGYFNDGSGEAPIQTVPEQGTHVPV